MNMLWRWLLLLAIAAAAPSQARSMVGVAFDLAVPRWQGQFGSRQVELQTKAAQAVAAWLGQQMGYMGFEPGATGPHRLVLHLELAPDAGTRQYKETRLRLELAGQADVAPLVWRFRPEDRYGDPTGGVDGFVLEIGLRLADIDRQRLVRELLGRVPVAHDAQLWKDPVGWVMPYRKSELCMDFRSLLRIENMMPSGAGPVLKEFMARASGDFVPGIAAGAAAGAMRGRLFTLPMPAQDGLSELNRAEPEHVAIRAV